VAHLFDWVSFYWHHFELDMVMVRFLGCVAFVLVSWLAVAFSGGSVGGGGL